MLHIICVVQINCGLKIKSPIKYIHSTLFFWFLWPIKKVFILVLFFSFLCLASNRFLWLCTFFLRGTMKHRSSTGCWLRADAKKKLANPFGQISIYFGLAEWPYYGRLGTAEWAAHVRWGGLFCWYWLCVGTSRYVLYFE